MKYFDIYKKLSIDYITSKIKTKSDITDFFREIGKM